MKIYLGADHRGYKLKEQIKDYLTTEGYEVIDKGPFKLDPDDDYPDYAFPVAEAVAHDKGSKGILLCGSSIGVSVCANKVKGIFCSQVKTPEESREDVEHHNPHLLALSADVIKDEDYCKEIINVWLNTKFTGGRHQRRLSKIWKYEEIRDNKFHKLLRIERRVNFVLLFIILTFVIVIATNLILSSNT